MFGRRRAAKPAAPFPPHPGPDHDGKKRVMPLEIWEGELGQQMRELGLSPDDERNIIPDMSDYERRFDERQAELDACVKQINAQLPDGMEVIPYAMLSWALWNQQYAETADFLLNTCDMYPVEAWNTMMLPADEKCAQMLNLPVHPRGYPAGFEDHCARIVLEIEAKHRAEIDPILALGTNAGMDDISRHGEIRANTIRSVAGIAAGLTSVILSEEVYFRHQKLFRGG